MCSLCVLCVYFTWLPRTLTNININTHTHTHTHTHRVDEAECKHVPESGHSSEAQVVVAECETVDHSHRHHLGHPGSDCQ